MEKPTFSTLPTEVHDGIAEHCDKKDLINLCLTAKWLNKICVRVLYRNVDLQIKLERMHDPDFPRILKAHLERQAQFIHTLLSHSKYGRHVRHLKGALCIPPIYIPPFYLCDISYDNLVSEEELWRAMQSLTHIQDVTLGSKFRLAHCSVMPTQQIPNGLFQSATSVRLRGEIRYDLAKSILDAVNPSALKHLYLDMIQDDQEDQDGRIIEHVATSSLLVSLTGRCTALRTLKLRRIGDVLNWHAASGDVCYAQCASFIRSVQGTLKRFTFKQLEGPIRRYSRVGFDDAFLPMDERFRRLIFPALISGDWPCLIVMELHGVMVEGRKAALLKELRAALGGHRKIVWKGPIRVPRADSWF